MTQRPRTHSSEGLGKVDARTCIGHYPLKMRRTSSDGPDSHKIIAVSLEYNRIA
jgi:hypothetical protein